MLKCCDLSQERSVAESMCRHTELSEKVLESEGGAVVDVLKWIKFLVPSWIWISMSPAWIRTTLPTTK